MSSFLEPSSYQYQHNSCALCGLTSAEGMKFMFCSKCRIVVYCSKEHQVSHWKRHKRFCRDNIWRKGSPLGIAAAASCSITVCACKKWHMESAELTNGQTLPQSPSSMYPSHNASFGRRGDDVNKYSDPSSGSSNVYMLNVEVDKHISHEGGLGLAISVPQSSTQQSFVFDTSRESSTHTFGYEDMPTKTSSAFVDSKSHLSLSGSNNNNNGYNNISTTSSSHHPPEEDLENHAPALYGIVGGSGVTTQQVPNQSSLLLTGGTTTGSINSSLGPTVYTTNSSTTTSSLLSHATKTHQNNLPQNDSQGGIAGNNHENREGSTDGNVIHLSTMTNSSSTIPFQHRNNMQPLTGQTSQQTRLWMLQVWKQVIEDLNRYGVCVVDNLLGDARGASVLREVQSMYSSGAFQDGQLVKGKDVQSKSIRGDKITWVDGREPNCKNIAVLIKILDNIVMGANNVANNGKLGSYTIKERSKAMVACYPGSGTHYVKHVDNPNDDGRCVTAIYYLNKDWNTRENGGLLRIFPEGWSHQVADIEPLFDRVIFFWSDRRNPHEVQPAFKTRYAITLWYFDSEARARAKLSSESNKLPNLKSLS